MTDLQILYSEPSPEGGFAPDGGFITAAYLANGYPKYETGKGFNSIMFLSSGMTISTCAKICRNFNFFAVRKQNGNGLSLGNECQCSNIKGIPREYYRLLPNFQDGNDPYRTRYINAFDKPFDQVPCYGESTLQCGGVDSIDVYVNSNFAYAAYAQTADSKKWTFYQSSYKNITTVVPVDSDTPATCAVVCATSASFGVQSNSPYFGKPKCYCFSSVPGLGTAVTGSLGIPCGVDSTKRCGGVGSDGTLGIIDVYKMAWSYSYFGYTTAAKATPAVTFTSAQMTVKLCATTCPSTSTFFGVSKVNGAQYTTCNCYSSASGLVSLSSFSGTSIPCSGDSTVRCGSSGVFDVYVIRVKVS